MKRALSATAGLLLYAISCLSQDNDKQVSTPSFDVGSEVTTYPKVQWIKGDPITKFEKDKIYVVECWATWCGPCVAGIPHLNELAKKFAAKIIVIGQNVWEEDKSQVEKFVKEQNDGMSYRVAYSGGPGSDFANTWLKPAGVNGIPHAFVIQDNKVVWKTNPYNFSEAAFQMLVDRKFTIAAAMVKSPLEKIRHIDSLRMARKYDEASTLMEAYLKENPESEMGFYTKINLLADQGKDAEELAYLKELYVSHPKVGRQPYYYKLMNTGDYNTLLMITGAELERKPDDQMTIMMRYHSFVKLNNYKAAADLINKVTAASSDVQLLSFLASFHQGQPKKGTEAESAVLKAGRKALELEPDNYQAALAVADMLWSSDKNATRTVITKTAVALRKDPKKAKIAVVMDNISASLDKDVFPDYDQMNKWYQDVMK